MYQWQRAQALLLKPILVLKYTHFAQRVFLSFRAQDIKEQLMLLSSPRVREQALLVRAKAKS
jgi:hypothetical protein